MNDFKMVVLAVLVKKIIALFRHNEALDVFR